MKNHIKVSKFAHHPSLIEKWRLHTKSGIVYLWYNDSTVLLNIYKLDPAFKIFTIAFSGKSDDKVRSGQIRTLLQFIGKGRFHAKSGIIYLCYNDSLIQPLHNWYCTQNIHYCVSLEK